MRLGYNNAPGLAYWWLDSYFDFDGPQSLRLRKDLDALQDWHRKEELPQLAEALKNLQAAALQDVTPAQVCQLSQFLETRLQAALDRATPTAVALGPMLTSAQLDHLSRALDKRNREWREEWLDGTPDERNERRMKNVTERAEDFYGRISTEQRNMLQAQLNASLFDATQQYREFLRRQQDILQTLRGLRNSGANELQNQAEVRALVVRSLQSPDPALRQYTEDLRSQTCESIAAFHNRTTPQQRQRLRAKLQGYEADARALLQR